MSSVRIEYLRRNRLRHALMTKPALVRFGGPCRQITKIKLLFRIILWGWHASGAFRQLPPVDQVWMSERSPWQRIPSPRLAHQGNAASGKLANHAGHRRILKTVGAGMANAFAILRPQVPQSLYSCGSAARLAKLRFGRQELLSVQLPGFLIDSPQLVEHRASRHSQLARNLAPAQSRRTHRPDILPIRSHDGWPAQHDSMAPRSH